jgi:hypothetical protein
MGVAAGSVYVQGLPMSVASGVEPDSPGAVELVRGKAASELPRHELATHTNSGNVVKAITDRRLRPSTVPD